MKRDRTDACHLLDLREHRHTLLYQGVLGLEFNGHLEQRLPNALNLSFPDVDGRELLLLAAEAVAASVGAACHEKGLAVSAVLGAMGTNAERARGAVRLSLGEPTTAAEVEHAASALIDAWVKQRGRPCIPQSTSVNPVRNMHSC